MKNYFSVWTYRWKPISFERNATWNAIKDSQLLPAIGQYIMALKFDDITIKFIGSHHEQHKNNTPKEG